MKRTPAMAAIAKARHVKALSVQEIKEYLAGADMGYSKPAEVHDFPSPAHVLKVASDIGLDPEQMAAAKELLELHKARARETGERFIDAVRELEMLFRSRKVQPAGLASAVRRLTRVESEYRLLHLESSRRMRALLTEEQIVRYALLRGRRSASHAEPTSEGEAQ